MKLEINIFCLVYYILITLSDVLMSHEEFLQSCKFSSNLNENSNINSKRNSYQGEMDIYWINLDRSIDRKVSMKNHLDSHGYTHQRLKGFTLNDIYIPPDVSHHWPHGHPLAYSEHYPTSRLNINESSPLYNYSIVVSGLWGRRRLNRINEVGCTTSHLIAIYHACDEALKKNTKYAMITEDDIFIPFHINYTNLIESAPSDFGILQIFNSNEESMENAWKQYNRRRRVWIPRYHRSAASYWSTCAYIINCDILRPLIKNIVKYRDDGWIDVKILAVPSPPKIEWGYEFCNSGVPEECCFTNFSSISYVNTSTNGSNPKIICSYSPRGFQADSYLYGLTRTYVISTPIITNGITGDRSTFHQDHVKSLHHNAFVRQKTYMNDMLSNKVPIPPYLKPACSVPIPVPDRVHRYTECSYRYTELKKQGYLVNPPVFYHISTQNIYNDVNNIITGKVMSSKSFNQQSIVENVGLDYRAIHYTHSDDIIIPNDVLSSWYTKDCIIQSNEVFPSGSDQSLSKSIDLNDNIPYKVYIRGLCGQRKDSNDLLYLNHTIMHLLAIYHAVHDNKSSSDIALISDETIESFPFNIDYNLLMESVYNYTRQNPWGIVQLSTRYDESIMTRYWVRYVRWNGLIWSDYDTNTKSFDRWPWKTYLINRSVLKPIIDSIVQRQVISPHLIVYNMRIIAGNRDECVPKSVCDKTIGSSSVLPTSILPIVISPRGSFMSDGFIPSLSRTILSGIPLVKSHEGVMQKKMYLWEMTYGDYNSDRDRYNNDAHAIHVIMSRQNDFIKGMLDDKHPIPIFANKSCVEVIK